MTTIKAFIKRHPVLTYYILVFAISWGGILMLIGGPSNIPGTNEQVGRLFPFALIVLFAGPSIAGILMNYLVDGRVGLRNLKLRLLQWRIEPRWYAIALLTGPLLVALVLLGLSLFSQGFMPGIAATKDKLAFVFFGIAWGLIGGGLLEELGWTGFAVPRLRLNYNILVTGLIVGVLWGVWHFLIAFWSSSSLSGGSSWAMFVGGFLAFYLLALPAYRVLMVWVYDRTRNLPVSMLMHASLSASTLILQPLATGLVSLIWNLVLGIVLWVIVAVVVVANPGRFSSAS